MKVKDVFLAIVLAVFIWFCFYFGLPVLNYGFIGWPFIVLFVGVIFILFDYDGYSDGLEGSWRGWVGWVLAALSILFIVILPIFSAPIFREPWSAGGESGGSYHNLIGNVEIKTFSNDISPVDPSRMVIIDYEVAAKLGDKKLVSETALGSITKIGKYTHQKVGDDLYYVAPLNHSGFWKWNSNRAGTPGYIIVNAHNQKDVRLVKEINGKPIRLKYQLGAYFGDYLPRYIYNHGYKNYVQYEYEFELNDSGYPYYVVPLYDKKIGYAGKNVDLILIVDPQTGEIKEYNSTNLPDWVDRAEPKALIDYQFNLWGEYVHGVFNWSNRDKLKTSQEPQIIYGNDGRCYLYSGVTSVGDDSACVGFILVDSRTKKVVFYKVGGAIETSAQLSAQGKVQEKEYVASRPRPYTVNGVWTYVMALKDREGLIKQVACVSYENYEIVGVGENITDAIRNYKSALTSKGNVLAVNSENKYNVVIDKILRVGKDTKDGQDYYYIILKEMPNKLFVGTSLLSNKLPVTEVGDSIKITFESGKEGEIFISTFDNLNLKFDMTPEQIRVDSAATVVEKRIDNENLDVRLKTKLENLTPEEKLKLLEK